mmetsp:Transcript_4061/g.9728  ORF Transcript_4061/g.9728 Transcript_4061/m.9728 type:complete len:114 (+) Transcript_4061:1698-2039(+)
MLLLASAQPARERCLDGMGRHELFVKKVRLQVELGGQLTHQNGVPQSCDEKNFLPVHSFGELRRNEESQGVSGKTPHVELGSWRKLDEPIAAAVSERRVSVGFFDSLQRSNPR